MRVSRYGGIMSSNESISKHKTTPKPLRYYASSVESRNGKNENSLSHVQKTFNATAKSSTDAQRNRLTGQSNSDFRMKILN